ncbi:hypothetical protein GCM10007063_35240 [Lentibacillus kapialis]|uniref:Uncharacterized protein n=1 Tax=Lentibacillus kapialis TaxID=340214 RepID=A0A917Q3I8_9BACI|nr:hypothetical protein GCM10007063_35240 [Lentibacillus kapialis]
MTAGTRRMDLNSLFVKAVMMFEECLIDVRVVFVQLVPWEKVKNGAVF